MKWIGQHIWDLTSRFRNDIYFEGLDVTGETRGLVVDANGKVSINPLSGDEHATHVYENVRNDEGATIPVGTPVYSKGEIGGSERIKVGIADASDPAKMPAIGITNTELTTTGDTKDGLITLVGVYNTNLSGFSGVSENDIVYVAIGGGLTITKPTGVNLIQNVGIVLKTNGTIIQGLQVTCIGRTNDVPTPLYIDHANQRVGIGTTSPGEKLHTVGYAKADTGFKAGNYTILNESGNETSLSNTAYYPMFFKTNNSTRMTITNAGNVGIGTTSPTSKLHVVGDARIQGNLTVNGTYTQIDTDVNTTEQWLVTNDGTGPAAVINQLGTEDIFDVQDDGTSVFYIEDGGNVGIGTTSPSRSLHVKKSGDNEVARFESDQTSSYVELEDANTTGQILIGTQGDNFKIHTAGTERFRIDGNGNVGIGTTSPGQALHLPDNKRIAIGTGQDSQWYHDGSNTYLKNATGDLYIQNSADDKDIIFQSDDGSGGVTPYLTLDGSSGYTKAHKRILYEDNVTAMFGTSGDMQILHDGSNSYISQNVTGNLYIQNNANDKDIVFQSDDGSGGTTAYLTIDGGLGFTTLQKNLRANDDVRILVGSGQDAEFFHDGANTSIRNTTGDLQIRQAATDKDIIFKCDDGGGGETEYFRVDGGEGRLVHSANSRYLDSVIAMFGTGADLQIYHNGTDSVIDNIAGDFYISQKAADKDLIFRADDGAGGFETYFFLDGSEGVVNFPDNKRLTFGTGRDLFLYHDGTNATFKNYVGDIVIQNEANDKDIRFKSDDGSGGIAEYFRVDGSSQITIFSKATSYGDDVRALFGASSDLKIYHNSSLSRNIIDSDVGNLYVNQNADDGDIVFRCDDGSGGTTEYFRLDGGLGYNVAEKSIRMADGQSFFVGTGLDGYVSHSGTNMLIANEVGDFVIKNNANDKDIIFQSDNGSGGVAEYFRVDGGATKTIVSKAFQFFDSIKAEFGDSSDLQIYHDGSNSFIDDAGTGKLRIRSNALQLEKYTGENMAVFNADGAASIYYDGSKKLETTSTGVEVTGNIAVSGSVQRQISTTHHTFTFGAAGSASQDYWVPFIGSSEQAAPNVTHRTIAPYTGILKKAIVHSTVAYGTSAQVRFHRINNGTASVFVNDNSTDDVTTNVTADMSTAYSSVAFDFTTGNTFSAGDQIGVSFVRNNTGLGDVAITLVWEYELF